MKLKLLGTAAAEGWPGLFCECEKCQEARRLGGKNIRSRSSMMIDTEYKIDFPPDTYMHVLREQLQLSKLEHLLITHAHQDHFYPEDLFMRREPFGHRADDHPLNVYGDEWVLERLNQVNPNWEAAGIGFHLLKPYQSYQIGAMRVTPLKAVHFPEKGALNYVFNLAAKTVLYGMDSSYFADQTWEALTDFRLDAVFLDCTNGSLPNSPVHMGLEGVKSVKERLLAEGIATKKTVFVATHFSHNGLLLHTELEEQLAKDSIRVGFDGMEVEI